MSGKRWYDFARMSQGEYRANLGGLNIFFGAVLGFVMAGTETLGVGDFAAMLVVVSAMVIAILYISGSRHRLAYGVLAVAMVVALPFLVGGTFGEGVVLPPKLQPTLAVWVAMTLLIEFAPRQRAPVPATGDATGADADR